MKRGRRLKVTRRFYYVYILNFCAGVEVRGGRILHAAPILKKFVGCKYVELEQWIKAKGGDCEEIKTRPSNTARMDL